ncbi:MAG: LPXTG cell wall anchor domain-containing protein [Coprobacillus sp.]|nr:LPXTG cell wall anchor domain-containing protein [Coprobacillus sp.]
MKLLKKVSAMVVSLLMALAMVVPVAAANPTITVKNIATDENVTLSYLKVVKQDKTTKTGWAFVDETVAQIFRDEYGKKDDQAILASLANSAAHSKALARLGNLSGFTGFTNNGERKTEVDGAGLYVVKVVDNSNKYTYNVMAAPINFEYANNPATLKNAELAVKRSETKLTKTVNDTDGAVHNGQTVTYTINVKVPSIDPTATNKLFKVTDKLTGAEYQKNTVVAKLGLGNNATTLDVTPTFDDATNSFELDLSSLIDDTNSNAGKDVTITYDVLVTSENDKVTNTANVSRTGSENYSSDSVDLYEGAITLTKTNAYEKESDKKLLAGAGFNVLDKDGNVLKFVDKGNNTYVLAKDQTVTTDVVTEVVTGANGQLVVKGLDKGKYQFKEVTAPDGYSINETNSSATLTITGDKATAEFTADTDMRDTEVGALPETGGIGTTIFTVGGCAIMVVAAALFFMNKKKHEK